MPMRHDPVAMFLSRQALPTLDRTRVRPGLGLARGAYVLADPPDGRDPEVILIASGSEVALVVRRLRGADRRGHRPRAS